MIQNDLHSIDEIDLGPLEWKVMRAMLDFPTGPMKDLVEATGLTRKTVTGRRTKLMEMDAIRVLPILRPPHTGPIYHHLWVTLKDRKHLPAIMEIAGDAFIELDYGESIYLFCRSENVREQHETFHNIENQEGVEKALTVLNSVFEQNNDRLKLWIDAELARWDQYRHAN